LDIRNLDTWCELLARILDAAAHIKKSENQLRRNTLFAHKLQNALRLKVEFWNIFCKL